MKSIRVVPLDREFPDLITRLATRRLVYQHIPCERFEEEASRSTGNRRLHIPSNVIALSRHFRRNPSDRPTGVSLRGEPGARDFSGACETRVVLGGEEHGKEQMTVTHCWLTNYRRHQAGARFNSITAVFWLDNGRVVVHEI